VIVARGVAAARGVTDVMIVIDRAAVMMMLEQLGEQPPAVVVHVREITVAMLVLIQCRAGQGSGGGKERRHRDAERRPLRTYASHVQASLRSAVRA